MIPYRIDVKIEEDELVYYIRAESTRQAVGKFLLDWRDTELLDTDIFSLYRKVVSDALTDAEEDILTYESDNIRIFCSRNRIILPDKPGDTFTDAVNYTYLNLPRYLKNVSEYDVGWILAERYEYLEENSFTLDEDDGRRYYCLKDAAEYIFSRSPLDESELPLKHIEEVLKTALEYDFASADHTEEIIFLNAIDISSISPN